MSEVSQNQINEGKKVLTKGALGACVVSIDAGSETRLLLQNLQLPDDVITYARYTMLLRTHGDVSSRHVPSWLFKRSLSMRDKQTSSRPDAALVTTRNKNPKPPNTCMVLHSGTVGVPERTTMHPTTCASPKGIPENERLIHPVEIKYCEDTGPGHQLKAAEQQQHTPLR